METRPPVANCQRAPPAACLPSDACSAVHRACASYLLRHPRLILSSITKQVCMSRLALWGGARFEDHEGAVAIGDHCRHLARGWVITEPCSRTLQLHRLVRDSR